MKRTLREKHTRPPADRMRRIHEWIKGGKFPNAVTMGRDLEVSDRTVKRDIEFMRDLYGLPIAYDEENYGYHYTQHVDQFPVVAMTEAEMFSLLVADKAIAQYHGTPFQKPLRMAFRKLTGQLDSRERYSLENLGLALSFRPFAPEDADLQAFRVITRALRERRVLEFDYRKLGAKKQERRRVHPYHLACIDNHWYLFAHDEARQALRTFVLTRLANPAATKERFVKPKNFDPDKYLAGSFTVMKGEEQHDVAIEFDAWGADLVRGRQWHSSQVFTDLPDGGARLTMRLTSLEEIERWVLSWGVHARVVGPAALQQRVGTTTAALASLYA